MSEIRHECKVFWNAFWQPFPGYWLVGMLILLGIFTGIGLVFQWLMGMLIFLLRCAA